MSWFIVNISPDGVEVIQSFETEQQADDRFDEFSERLPHAFLEIAHASELPPSIAKIHA